MQNVKNGGNCAEGKGEGVGFLFLSMIFSVMFIIKLRNFRSRMSVVLKIFLMFILRERESVSWGEGQRGREKERERERGNPKQTPCSEQSQMWGLIPQP